VWIKVRVNRGQEFLIAGYVSASQSFDSILVCYYEDEKLLYLAKISNGFVPASREVLFNRFSTLERESLTGEQQGKMLRGLDCGEIWTSIGGYSRVS
jgi:ATP-dependent DNA ligase